MQKRNARASLYTVLHSHINYRAAFGCILTFSRQTNESCLACGTSVASSTSKPYASSYSYAKTRCENVMPAHRCTERCIAWPRPPFRAPYGPQEPTPRPHGPFPHPFPSHLAQPACSSPHEATYRLRSAGAANLQRCRSHLCADLSGNVAASRGW
jgi:hypothetical protein